MSSIPLADRIERAIARAFHTAADRTLVNGIEYPGGADWAEAIASREQYFIAESDIKRGIWNVDFGAVLDQGLHGDAVLSAPWNMILGSEVQSRTLKIKGVVKRLSPDTQSGRIVGVRALVVVLVRS